MQIDDLSSLLTTIASPRVTPVLNAWRAGQILEAVVTRVSNVGTATLNVNNFPIEVRTLLPLEIGGRLLLEVTQTGTQVALRVVTTPPAPTAPAASTPQETLASAVRALAPRQGPLQPVLEQLLRWADTAPAPLAKTPLPMPAILPATGAAPGLTPFTLPSTPPAPAVAVPALPSSFSVPIPPPLRELAQRVAERVATPQQVATPDGLKQAIKDSGAFFEHKLASPAAQPEAQAPLERDVKAALLQLVSLLKTALPTAPATPAPTTANGAHGLPLQNLHRPTAPTPAMATSIETQVLLQSLSKDTEAAVARVTLQQLLSLPENKTDAPQWIFDVPVRWGDVINVFHLHVYREKHPRDPKHPPAWCVRLSFDLVTLGAVGVLVTMLGGAVSISIWAKENTTARLFDQHLKELQAQLHDAGVAVHRISCERGAAPFSADTPLAQKKRNLIDERA